MGVRDANYKVIKTKLGVPDDEPIFVIRGQDDLALHILTRYSNAARQIEDKDVRPSEEWFNELDEVIADFAQFRADNADKIKVPD